LRFAVLARFRPYLPTAALALLIVYFAFHAVTGDQGLLTSSQRSATLVAKSKELAALRIRRQAWRCGLACCATAACPRTCWRKGRALG